jgi:hypothetical protein
MCGTSMGHIIDVSSTTPHDIPRNHYGDRRVQATGRYTATLRPVAAWVQDPKRSKFRGAGRRLAAAEQPKTGSILEPARPKMADDTPRGLTSRLMTSEPGKESRDFDGSVPTLARNRTRRSPMLTHETLPVLGAGVVGTTSRVGQGQSCLSADVPGISMALSQEDRLRPKDRLRQQPAGNFIEESQSRQRRRNSSNSCFAERSLASTRLIEARTSVTPATPGLHQSTGRSLPHERI